MLYNKLGEIVKINLEQPIKADSLGGAEAVIVKPSIDSGGGYGVRLYSIENNGEYIHMGTPLTILELKKLYGQTMWCKR